MFCVKGDILKAKDYSHLFGGQQRGIIKPFALCEVVTCEEDTFSVRHEGKIYRFSNNEKAEAFFYPVRHVILTRNLPEWW